MANKQEFESKLATLKKVFNRRCLFCDQIIESIHFPLRENQTLLSTCEFCFDKYEVLKEGKELETIKEVFPNICYFCQEKAQRKLRAQSGGFYLIDKKIEGISHCPSCAARYKLLRELENEQTKIQQAQI